MMTYTQWRNNSLLLSWAKIKRRQSKRENWIHLRDLCKQMDFIRVISRVQEKFIFPDPNLLRADELQDAYQIFLSIKRYTYLVATYFRMVKGIAMKILSIFDWNISITIICFAWIGCRRWINNNTLTIVVLTNLLFYVWFGLI